MEEKSLMYKYKSTVVDEGLVDDLLKVLNQHFYKIKFNVFFDGKEEQSFTTKDEVINFLSEKTHKIDSMVMRGESGDNFAEINFANSSDLNAPYYTTIKCNCDKNIADAVNDAAAPFIRSKISKYANIMVIDAFYSRIVLFVLAMLLLSISYRDHKLALGVTGLVLLCSVLAKNFITAIFPRTQFWIGKGIERENKIIKRRNFIFMPVFIALIVWCLISFI